MEKLHQKFLSENTNLTISRGQFFKHHPFWIMSPRFTDKEACACKIHENFTNKVKKLHQIGVTTTSSTSDIVASAVCDKGSIDCIYQRCDTCKNFNFPTVLDPNNKDNIVSWNKWVSRSTPFSKKNQDGNMTEIEVKKTMLENKSANIEKLLHMTQEDLPRICTHVYNIGHRFEWLKNLKENLSEDEAVVHVDYSENYKVGKWHKEVKDAHFGGSHQQVTLHTVVIYLSGWRVESFSSVSECLRHDAVATWAHLDPVLEHFRTTNPGTLKIQYTSSLMGPLLSTETRPQFTMSQLCPS